MDGFSTHAYLRTRANAELDFQATKQAPAPQASVPPAPAGVTHPRLYALLKDWRDGTASDLNQEPYMVLPTKSLVELVQVLPVNMSALKKVKGIGAMKSAQFGAEILEIIRAYCATYQIDTSDLLLAAAVPVAEKVPKPDTKSVSLDLLKSGKTIDEIAAERGMVRSTIEGHLGHYVGLGELDIYDLLEDETVDTLEMYFWENGNGSSAAAREHFGDRFSYGEIKLVLKHMEYKYSTKS
jgi:predicted transcriptional regulator